MDNASKALIMAGGILIAVLVIGVSIYVINSARGVARVSNERIEANAIQSFNKFYTSYGNNVQISGVDALNIYRKAMDDNTHEAHTRTINLDNVDSTISILSNAIDVGDTANCAEVFSRDYTYSYSPANGDYINTININ